VRTFRPRGVTNENMTPVRTAVSIAVLAVLIGLADLPYGYYTLLRLFLCGVSLFFLFGARLRLEDWQQWTLGGIAVLYNPLIPIHLGEKGLWGFLNVATVALFWVVATRQTR
jgi:hypothetical protein